MSPLPPPPPQPLPLRVLCAPPALAAVHHRTPNSPTWLNPRGAWGAPQPVGDEWMASHPLQVVPCQIERVGAWLPHKVSVGVCEEEGRGLGNHRSPGGHAGGVGAGSAPSCGGVEDVAPALRGIYARRCSGARQGGTRAPRSDGLGEGAFPRGWCPCWPTDAFAAVRTHRSALSPLFRGHLRGGGEGGCCGPAAPPRPGGWQREGASGCTPGRTRAGVPLRRLRPRGWPERAHPYDGQNW